MSSLGRPSNGNSIPLPKCFKPAIEKAKSHIPGKLTDLLMHVIRKLSLEDPFCLLYQPSLAYTTTIASDYLELLKDKKTSFQFRKLGLI